MTTPDQRPVTDISSLPLPVQSPQHWPIVRPVRNYTVHLTSGQFAGLTYVIAAMSLATAVATAQGEPHVIHVGTDRVCPACYVKLQGPLPEGWPLWHLRALTIAEAEDVPVTGVMAS